MRGMIAGRKCPVCGENLNGEWQYCPKCGKQVSSASLEQQIADKPTLAHESEADILVKEAKQLYFERKYWQATEKCRLAAKMDHGEAYFMLGLLTARGHLRQKSEDAITWYKKGREKQNAAAINAIGVMHYKGDGVPKDIEEAISCFREATNLGDLFAPYNLARCYEQGIGVSQDEDKARELLYLAIERKNKYAIRYFQAKLMNDYRELEEKEIIFGEWVYSEEYWGYRECRRDPYCTVYMPIYTESYYKENADVIKKHNESYRRQYLFKLPELRIM